jgi:hypothetical protein
MCLKMINVQFAVHVPQSWREFNEVVEDETDFCWLPVSKATSYNDLLIDEWLSRERLTCCDFQGGFLITVNGTRWNGTLIDEYWMTMSWFNALERLIRGESRASAFPWEEGEVILERSGDHLTLYEKDHVRHGECPPITLPFTAFTQHIAGQSRLFANWVRSLHESIALRNPDLSLLPTHIQIARSPEEKLIKIQQEISAACREQAERFVHLIYQRLDP